MSNRCDHIRPEDLSAYLDQDLDPRRMQHIGAHLKECETCSQVANELGALCSGLAKLSQIEPRHNLWTDVAARLDDKPQGNQISWWQRIWMLPAAAAAGAGAVIAVIFLLGGIGTDKNTTPAGPVDALTAVTSAEKEYLKAIDALEKTLHAEKGRMSPGVRNVATQGLAEINQTIEKYRAELGRNPADMETRESMLAVYQQKVDFMSELVTDILAE